MDENNILKKKKKNYYNHRHNQNKNYYYKKNNKPKKNLLLENNDSDEVQEILEFNKQEELPKEESSRKIVQVIQENIPDYEEMDIMPIRKSKAKKNIFSNLFSKDNFKYALGFCVLVIALFGVSYSYFNYKKTDSRQADIVAGEMYVKLVENATSITLNKMYPRTNEEARSRNDNYFDFTIKAKNTSEKKSILYTININNGETVNGKTRIDPKYVRLDLQEKVNNEYQYIEEGVNLTNYSFQGIIPVNTTSEITKEYRLRIWINDDIVISDTNPNATHTETEFNNLFANFDISVNSEDKVYVPLAGTIASKVSSVNYIASYDDIITQNPTFTTQDQVSSSATKQTVYYYTGNDAAANANVLFAGYCWQIIRTTDNGGVRMIYNGVAVNNKCETTRTATKGINGQNGTTQTMSAATLFGRSYDYNLDTGKFTIEDSTGLPSSWTTSDNNSNGTVDYKELIGTYTCLSNSNTCSTLYYVGSINQDNTAQAYVTKYTIGDVAHFSQLGTSSINPNYGSLALVGYMFDEVYDYKYGIKSGEYFTNAVWENGAYMLSNGNNGTSPDATHHYICDSDCTKVRYYYYVSGGTRYYILLENGKTALDALKEMINYKANANDSDGNINVYNSSIKGYLDNWYKKNLTAYTSYLDGATVYCNDRSIRDLGGWNPSGTSSSGTLLFKQFNKNMDLNCLNETDRFAVTNSKAKLFFPIGLLTEPERYLMTLWTSNFAETGQDYWGASPSNFGEYYAYIINVNNTGTSSYRHVSISSGARGVITLKPGTEIESGTGTYTDPYVVGPLVTRTN